MVTFQPSVPRSSGLFASPAGRSFDATIVNCAAFTRHEAHVIIAVERRQHSFFRLLLLKLQVCHQGNAGRWIGQRYVEVTGAVQTW